MARSSRRWSKRRRRRVLACGDRNGGDRFGSLPIPVISGLSFGHIEQKLTLPIGIEATLDADAGTVSVNEAAVV